LAAAVGELEHTRQSGVIFEHVDVFERNFSPGEILTGSRSIGSKILAKDKNRFAAHRLLLLLALINGYYYESINSACFRSPQIEISLCCVLGIGTSCSALCSSSPRQSVISKTSHYGRFEH
jgi:hypothetical protein